MAAPLFSNICIYRNCSFGFITLACLLLGGRVVGGAAFANGERGEMWAEYI